MKLSPCILTAVVLCALSGMRCPAAEVVLVNWNHTWDYMMPMGQDPATTDTDFNQTWFQKPVDFAAHYDGPVFGGATVAGVPGNIASINRGTGQGPFSYDVIDYFGSAGSEVSAPGTVLSIPASGNRYASYFRTTFTVSQTRLSPRIRMILDDGALIYLDGVPVARVNMLDSVESYTSLSADAVAGLNETGTANLNNEACVQSFGLSNPGDGTQADATVTLPVVMLSPGPHSLAVSVRSNSATSSDLCMGLQLLAQDSGIAATASNVQRQDNGPGLADDTFTFDVTVTSLNVPGASSWTSDNLVANGPVSGAYASAAYTFTYPAQAGNGALNTATIKFRDGLDAAVSTTLVVGAPPAITAPPVMWGRGVNGQMGDGTIQTRPLPGAVDMSGVLAGQTLTAIAAGEAHSIVLSRDGKVFAWGYNFFGQMGNGSTVTNQPVPVAVNTAGVLAGKTVTAIKAGLHHCLVRTSDGKLYSWGHNDSGVLGDGSATQRNLPVAVDMSGVLAGKNITAIAAGYLHNLVLTSDGKLYTWGWNASGQLGDGTFTSKVTPVAVTMTGALAGKTVTAIASGREHCLAVTSDGKVFAWGLNANGQLGDGSTTNRNVPTAVNATGVLAGKVVTAVDAGYAQTLALTSSGELFSWGSNALGQLGDGTTVSRPLPGRVTMSGALEDTIPVSIAAGRDHCAVLTSSGRIFAWGDNAYGEIGDGTAQGQPFPVPVLLAGTPTRRFVASMDAGTGFTAALTISTPAILVEQPEGAVIPEDAATVDFGDVVFGGSSSRGFVIRNTGADALHLSGLTLAGGAATDFAVQGAPTLVVPPGGSVPFSLLFTATAAGDRNAVLHITSDAGGSPFDIMLAGRGRSSLEIWRHSNFGSYSSAGSAADNADPDGDGLENLVEYAFNLDPKTTSAAALPFWQYSNDHFLLTFSQPPGVAGVTCLAEYSTDLHPDHWTIIQNSAALPLYTFSVPAGAVPRLYLRLRVTSP